MIRLNDDRNRPLIVRLTLEQKRELLEQQKREELAEKRGPFQQWHDNAIGQLASIPVLNEPNFEGRIHEVTVFRNGAVFIKCGVQLRLRNSVSGPCADQMGSDGMFCLLRFALDAGDISIKDLEPGKYEISYASWWGDHPREDVIVSWTGSPPLGDGQSTTMEYGHGWLGPSM